MSLFNVKNNMASWVFLFVCCAFAKNPPTNPSDVQDHSSWLFVSGVLPPVFGSCTTSAACNFADPIANVTRASWITQDPSNSSIFYAAIEITWPPNKTLDPAPGVQKWNFDSSRNSIVLEEYWMLEDDLKSKDKMLHGICAPVHTTIVDDFVAVSWLCGADSKVGGEVQIFDKDTLQKKFSFTGKRGFHGAFVHNDHLYVTMMNEKKVCWIKVSSFTSRNTNVDLDDSVFCVTMTAPPRHIAFYDDKAYVVCQFPGTGIEEYHNFYEYTIEKDGNMSNPKPYCLSSLTPASNICTQPGPDVLPDQLSEVLVNKEYLYVSNRVGSEGAKNTTDAKKKRSGIFVLELEDIVTDVQKPLFLNSLEHEVPMRVKSMGVNEDGSFLVTAGQYDHTIAIWDLQSNGGINSSATPKVVHTNTEGDQWNGPAFVGFVKNPQSISTMGTTSTTTPTASSAAKCEVNQYVSSGNCVLCDSNTYRAAGDDPAISGDTACEHYDLEFFVSGQVNPKFKSCDVNNPSTCILSADIPGVTHAAWMTQDPLDVGIFYVAIYNYWSPDAETPVNPAPGVQKWRFHPRNNSMVVEASWQLKFSEMQGMQHKPCAPVHTTIVLGTFVAVSWHCRDRNAEISIHSKDNLNKKFSFTGSSKFGGAFVRQDYLYITLFAEKMVCWVKVESWESQNDDVGVINDGSCVTLTANPRHIAFSSVEPYAYVACESSLVNNRYHNLYTYEIGLNGNLIKQKQYCLSSSGLAADKCENKSNSPDIVGLTEILVNHQYLYVSNRVGNYTEMETSSEVVKTMNGIFVLKHEKGTVTFHRFLTTEGNGVPLRVKSMGVNADGKFLVAAGEYDLKIVMWRLEDNGGIGATASAIDVGNYGPPGKEHKGPTFIGFVKNPRVEAKPETSPSSTTDTTTERAPPSSITVATETSDAVETPVCTKAGLVPDPTDCGKFYICFAGARHAKYKQNCPSGTLYDTNISNCNHASVVQRNLPECKSGQPRPTGEKVSRSAAVGGQGMSTISIVAICGGILLVAVGAVLGVVYFKLGRGPGVRSPSRE